MTSLLRDTGLSRRLLDVSGLSDAQGLRFPCDRSIGLHLVLRGTVHLHAPGLAAPLALHGGDIALMARGCKHVLSLRPQLQGQAVAPIDEARAVPPGLGDAALLVSSAYQFWHAPLHPLFAEMPPWTVLRAAEHARLGPLALTCGMLAEELGAAAAGGEIVVHGLADLVFTYTLRELVSRCAAAQAGWSQASRDPQVGQVLARMHEDPAHAWTLDELARSVGLSRSALAERFRGAMGDTPLNHLRTLRMQRAVRLLCETERSLEAVAAAVGYQDAFSFSKVFKRSMGLSPRAFRQRDAAERQSPYRFA